MGSSCYPFSQKKFIVISVFLSENVLKENEPQKTQNLKKILRKSPALNAWAAIFKNVDFY